MLLDSISNISKPELTRRYRKLQPLQGFYKAIGYYLSALCIRNLDPFCSDLLLELVIVYIHVLQACT